ncbi:MAG: lytic transglycosylase domain-containing protein [Planctomycetota bacterium]
MASPAVAWVAKRAAAALAGRAARRWGWGKALLFACLAVGLPLFVAGSAVLGAAFMLLPFGRDAGPPGLPLPPPGAGGQAPGLAVLTWLPLLERAAEQHGLDRALVLAVVEAESGGDPLAVSPAGALGLMQVMPDKFGPDEDPFDPEANLRAGCSYLRAMLDRYGGDVELALAAYNAGPGAVDRFGGVPPFPETIAYVERVMLLYAETAENPGQPVVKEAAGGR